MLPALPRRRLTGSLLAFQWVDKSLCHWTPIRSPKSIHGSTTDLVFPGNWHWLKHRYCNKRRLVRHSLHTDFNLISEKAKPRWPTVSPKSLPTNKQSNLKTTEE